MKSRATYRMAALDREVFALALPALGALAAEPLYVLVDTAIVGHLGTTQLASLAIAATVLTTGFTIFNFLTYGTTAQVARLHGAGRERDAAALGSQALWLGARRSASCCSSPPIALAPAAVRLMGGEGEVADGAVLYLRIAALGAPFFMLATAGQGFLRGIGDLRTPLLILVAAHVVNVVLELLFVYGFGWGLAGSAWGTVIAQAGMGLAFVEVQRRAGFEPPLLARMRPLMKIGSEIAVRTTALLGSFLVASAVLARSAPPSLAAHQIAFQLFVFLALVLDALAIAAQVMVGRLLGAGDAARARAAATRVILWSAVVGAAFGLVLIALTDVLPHAFTGDDRVVERAQEIWWLFAALMPLNGVVFALDGILIGAGDTRYLMLGMLASAAVYIPVALLALERGWGIEGVWWGLAGLIAMRALTNGTASWADDGFSPALRRSTLRDRMLRRTLVIALLLALLAPRRRAPPPPRARTRSPRCRPPSRPRRRRPSPRTTTASSSGEISSGGDALRHRRRPAGGVHRRRLVHLARRQARPARRPPAGRAPAARGGPAPAQARGEGPRPRPRQGAEGRAPQEPLGGPNVNCAG